MGQAAQILRALSCHDLYVYVLNESSCYTRCCGDEGLCTCEYHTAHVDPPDDDSVISVEVVGCCSVRESHDNDK